MWTITDLVGLKQRLKGHLSSGQGTQMNLRSFMINLKAEKKKTTTTTKGQEQTGELKQRLIETGVDTGAEGSD